MGLIPSFGKGIVIFAAPAFRDSLLTDAVKLAT
jgi:hypothetical protein